LGSSCFGGGTTSQACGIDAELGSPNPRGRAAEERHLVDRELARKEGDRRIQERRRANLRDLQTREANYQPEPEVFIRGRALENDERQMLAAIVRWVMSKEKGETE
jgi:hypothetical protein